MRAPNLLFLAVALPSAACLESPGPTTETAPQGPSIEVKVAPLTLPGLGDACYDVEVRNGAEDIVWARGDFALDHPADPTTLCARQFGNASGGDISYVGPCDADSPAHTVHLAVDTLYDATNQPLADWQNPCPGIAPCKLNVTCQENADTPVSFNLTIMRAAQQGFFDVAVNFDAIFCSAKVDCTYDDAGNEPIELLHDPATGERTQTAVIGLACSAGPGSDVDTAILMNDIRVYCGDVAPVMFGGSTIQTCEDDGEAFYGLLQSFSMDGVRLDPVVWRRDGATGAYEPATVTVSDPSGLAPAAGMTGTPPFDGGIPYTVLEDGTKTYALGLLAKLGPMTGDDFTTSFVNMRVAIMEKTSSDPSEWEVTQVLAYPDSFNATRPVVFPELSDARDYLVTVNGFELRAESPANASLLAIHRRIGTTGWTYDAPIALARDTSTYYDCERELYPGLDTFVLACQNATDPGRWDLLVYDLTATPSGSGPNGRFLSPSIIPLQPADFNFAGGVTALRVVEVRDLGAVGAGESAQILARVEVDVEVSPGSVLSRSQLVHFTRSTEPGGAWVPAPPILGRANLARDPLPHDYPVPADSWIYPMFFYELASGEAVLGGHMFFVEGEEGAESAQMRSFVGHFKDGVWTGPWTFDLDWGNVEGVLVAPNGTLWAYGDRLTAPLPSGTREAFLARLDPGSPGLVTTFQTLPRPAGWVAHFNDAIAGVRGSNLPADTVRRLAGVVLEPDGAGGFHRHGIEWRFEWDTTSTPQRFRLESWVVFGPTEPIADPGADAPDADWTSSLIQWARDSNLGAPRFSSIEMRCDQIVEELDLGDDQVLPFIVDPDSDLVSSLSAVTSVTPVGAHNGGPGGTVIIRDPVASAEILLPEPDLSGAVLLDPTHTAEGNVWNSANPKPSDIPAHILQMASYHGEESLLCDGEPCNKLYWNTAIAFDPTVPGCRLAFEAVAARVSSLVEGQLPPDSMWPVIIGRVPLTTTPTEEGAPASLACTRHPLGSPELFTLYEPQDFDWEACYGFGTTGSPPVMSWVEVEPCPLDVGDYLELEMGIAGGGGDDGP